PFSHIYKQDDLPHLQSFPTRRSSDLSFGSPNDDEAEEHGDNGGRDPRVNAECVFNSRRNVIGLNSWYQEFSPITFLLLLNTHSRSEEHTSELQSRFDIVCRLLLEKKI